MYLHRDNESDDNDGSESRHICMMKMIMIMVVMEVTHDSLEHPGGLAAELVPD